MADARSLLRAHRAANRIEQPHAAYSDAGKLLCKLCHEAVRSEALWDAHVRGAGHQQSLSAAQQQQQQQMAMTPVETVGVENTHKRKHEDVTEEQAGDEALDVANDPEAEVRRKKSRTDMVGSASITASAGFAVGVSAANSNGNGDGNGNVNGNMTPIPGGVDKEKTATPPSLTRRKSTPAHGVEIQIPSRPATPLVGEGSSNSTPRLMAKSPLIGSVSGSAGSTPNATSAGSVTTESLAVPKTAAVPTTSAAPSADAIDEAEWAAFEAEVAVEDTPHATGYAEATISAPAMTTAEAQAKSIEEENERRKLALDAQLDDEREDATRALEDEFDDMAELESRVRKLKERREELRRGSIANLRARAASLDPKQQQQQHAAGKENMAAANGDDEESDEEEDWDDAFRFRA